MIYKEAWYCLYGEGEYVCQADGNCEGKECQRHTRTGGRAIRAPYQGIDARDGKISIEAWPVNGYSRRPITEDTDAPS